MSFFKEWDLYYVPKTDYNPKWINYKYKNKKFYNNACVAAKALTSSTEWCTTDGPWYDRCKNCSGSGWAYLVGKGCWRVKTSCPSNTYNYSSLCYSEDAACKPEMLTNQNDYHCTTDWNIRDLKLYDVVDRDSCCASCIYGAKKVSSYDPSVFTPLGTVVKSINLVCQNKDQIYCDQMNKCFRVAIDLTKITNWSVFDTIKDIFENKSYTGFENIAYLNFIALIVIKFYLMMNVSDTTAGMTLAGLGAFTTHVPVFMVFKASTNDGLLESATYRDYSLSFYKNGLLASTTTSGNPQYRFKQATINKDYLKLGGIAIPTSNLTFKTIGSQGVFLVSPTQFCQDQTTTNKTVADATPKYTEGTAIIYLVYYNMNDLRLDQSVSIMNDFKTKYIDNPNLVVSPQARAWNEYVYYNHVLPNICYGVETNASYCNEIMDYDASPPALIKQNCSLTTSGRFPDCKTYLVSDITKKQPVVNPTRTYSQLDSKQLAFCNRNDTLECQCYNREKHGAYKSFQSSNYSFPVDMKNNAGCWYKPCLDDPQSNIFIESAFRAEKRNCPEAVCQSVITVMNRPENNANFSNLELRNSCSVLSAYTPAPATTAGPTTTPEPDQFESATVEPPPIPPPQNTIDEEESNATADVKTIQTTLGIYVVVFILLVSGVIIASSMRPAQQQGTFRTLFRTFFGTLWFIPVVLIGIVSALLIGNARALNA